MKRNSASWKKQWVMIAMLFLAVALLGSSLAADLAAQSTQPQFTFQARGRTYTVTVTSLPGSGFRFANHWLYEPSGILPSPQTGNQYYVLFSSNQTAPAQFGHEAIYLASSPTGYDQFTTPAAILDLSTVSNICDIATARPVWDGSLWHVYVQGIVWQNGGCNPPGYIFEATGPALQWGSLQWVKTPGTNNVMPIITSRSSSGEGIGQDHQWFYTAPYTGLTWLSFLGIFNDWNFTTPDLNYCPTCAVNGTNFFGYLSADGVNNQYFWYYTSPVSARSNVDASKFIVLWPDVFLGRSADEATLGDPAITMGFDRGVTGRGVGFWGSTTLAPYPGGTVSPYTFVDGTYPSSYPGTIDGPRFARNVYGYLDPIPSSSPKTWQSYIYYGITTYGTYDGPPSAFGVSQVTITEQGPAPVSYPVSVSKGGSGSGTVTSAPAGIDCGSTCSANFSSGTQVTLTAAAGSGSTFTGWSGACTGTGTCSVTMDASKSVIATFNLAGPQIWAIVDGVTYNYTIYPSTTISIFGEGFSIGGNIIQLQRSGYGDVWLYNGDGHYFWDYNGTQINASLDSRVAAGTWTLTVRNSSGGVSSPYTLTIQNNASSKASWCYSSSYPWYQYGYTNWLCSAAYHPTYCYTSGWQWTTCP
jgi:hypothetical protein